MLSGLVDEYDPRHVYRINSEIQRYGGKLKEIQVECFNLNEILVQNNIWHIDYLSLDVEGAELPILESIDFGSF